LETTTSPLIAREAFYPSGGFNKRPDAARAQRLADSLAILIDGHFLQIGLELAPG